MTWRLEVVGDWEVGFPGQCQWREDDASRGRDMFITTCRGRWKSRVVREEDARKINKDDRERSTGFSRPKWGTTFINFISTLQAAHHVFEGIFF
jgi:hypothetical protein